MRLFAITSALRTQLSWTHYKSLVGLDNSDTERIGEGRVLFIFGVKLDLVFYKDSEFSGSLYRF